MESSVAVFIGNCRSCRQVDPQLFFQMSLHSGAAQPQLPQKNAAQQHRQR